MSAISLWVPQLPPTASAAATTAGVTVTFATSRGMLSSRTAITGEDGSASVELRGVPETVGVTVSASAPDYRPAQPGLLLVPPTAED